MKTKRKTALKKKIYEVITKRKGVTGISPHKSRKEAERYVKDYKKLLKKYNMLKNVKIKIRKKI